MSRAQAPRTNHQASDNAHQAEDNEDDRFSGFLASLEGAEVVLYVHREDLGKRGHLGNLRFDPTQHNIGHLYAVIRKEWGPGSYWIRTQARNGAGFGRGSFRLDIADLTPALATAQAAPVSAPAPVQVPAAPAQAPLDVNGLVLGLLRDLVGRLGVPNSASMDPSQLATVVQSAMQAQNSGIQAIAQRLDPNVQGFGVAREILKLARDLGGQVPEQAAGGGGGMDLMMLWMMMQGGSPQQMLPMMMMMQQPGQGQNPQQQQQQMMQMMMMMQMMQNGGRMPMQQMQQQQQMQPPGWGPFPGPWGPVPASSTPTRATPTSSTPTSSTPTSSTPTSSPATPTSSTPATPTSSTPATPTSSPAAANLLHLEGYGDASALAGGLPELLGLSRDQLEAELATMSPEEQRVVMAVQRSLG